MYLVCYSIELFQLFVFCLFSVWLWMGLFFFSTLQWWIYKPVVSVSRVYYHSEWRATTMYIVQAWIISVRHFPGPLRTVRASQLPAVKIPLCAFTFWPRILISTDSLLTMVKIIIGVAFRGLVLALILYTLNCFFCFFLLSCQFYECQDLCSEEVIGRDILTLKWPKVVNNILYVNMQNTDGEFRSMVLYFGLQPASPSYISTKLYSTFS